ncbi:hypothetical protein FXN63_12315 [Pigmentiphaga aceris]|uniref:Uncharacterized protein n=1 Tax=Pigmentiphaga aceris TaxID=1940612 RepID=A0A5C0B1K9_9BURK|nr:DUF6152 family protein [Pigmentiphaga aceris]QEI06527.1 hypothetical protein FXN63_12315 [Pigmentiphaga aceris]
MAFRSFNTRLNKWVAGIGLTGLLVASAAAHHGWSWADSEQVKLNGTVRKVEISPPHPWLDVETANDGMWRVELGNPSQTERSGFVAGSAKPGDTVQVNGNRARDHKEKRMKAVQITVGSKTYDIYPERIGK